MESKLGFIVVIKLKKINFIFYLMFLIICFFLFLRVIFPINSIKNFASLYIQNNLFKYNYFKKKPNVSIENVKLCYFFGISFYNIKICFPGESVFVINEIYIKYNIYSILLNKKSFFYCIKINNGTLSGFIKFSFKNILNHLDITILNIDFEKISFFFKKLGIYLSGTLNGKLILDVNKSLKRYFNASLIVKSNNLSINLRKFSLYNNLFIPKISLGKFNANLILEKGKIKSQKFSLYSSEIAFDVNFTVKLAQNLFFSKIYAQGLLELKNDFFIKNKKIRPLINLLLGQSGSGHKHAFLVTGLLINPKISITKKSYN